MCWGKAAGVPPCTYIHARSCCVACKLCACSVRLMERALCHNTLTARCQVTVCISGLGSAALECSIQLCGQALHKSCICGSHIRCPVRM